MSNIEKKGKNKLLRCQRANKKL